MLFVVWISNYLRWMKGIRINWMCVRLYGDRWSHHHLWIVDESLWNDFQIKPNAHFYHWITLPSKEQPFFFWLFCVATVHPLVLFATIFRLQSIKDKSVHWPSVWIDFTLVSHFPGWHLSFNTVLNRWKNELITSENHDETMQLTTLLIKNPHCIFR